MKSPKTARVNGTDDEHRRGQTARKSKTKSKSKSESKSKTKRSAPAPRSGTASPEPRLSAAERSRQNGRKSKGPRTQAGKERVRYNALTHGITAKSPLLPGEDRSEFETRRAALHSQMRPRNELESELIDRLAQSFWVSRRSQRALVAQLTYRLRHEPLAAARGEQQQAAKLGQYLLKDVFRPVGILPCEQAGGARHPAQLVFKLEGTLNGCDWLLARFDRLKEHASIPGNWIENDGLELVRLLGKYRGELISDDLVAMVLLDSECIAEESTSRAVAYHNATGHTLAAAEANAQAEAAAAKPKAQAPASPKPKPDLIAYYPDGTLAPLPSDSLEEDDDLDDDDDDVAFCGPASDEYRRLARNFGRVKYVLDETFRLVANQPSLGPCVLRLEKLNPKNVEQARQRLTLVIDEHARRLREIWTFYSEIRAADEARAAERIAFGPGPEGERKREYVQAHDRLVNQSIATLLKVRKAGNDGTIDEVDAEDLLQSVAQAPQPDFAEPSLALRAGMEPPPPDTSPKRQRGISVVPKTTARVVSQALCEEITCAEPPIGKNEPHAMPTLPASEPPRASVVAGTVPVPSSYPAPSAPRGKKDQGPLTPASCRTSPRPGEGTRDEPTNDQGPTTKDETQQKRLDALPRSIQRDIEDIRRRLWHHNGRPHLSKQEVSEFVAFIDKHLGTDSIGPGELLAFETARSLIPQGRAGRSPAGGR